GPRIRPDVAGRAAAGGHVSRPHVPAARIRVSLAARAGGRVPRLRGAHQRGARPPRCAVPADSVRRLARLVDGGPRPGPPSPPLAARAPRRSRGAPRSRALLDLGQAGVGRAGPTWAAGWRRRTSGETRT